MRRALVLAIGVALAAAAPAAAASPAAHVWVTTPDGAMKMSDRGSVPFRPGGSDALTISVDPSRRYQTDGGLRRLDHRFLGARALRASTGGRARRRCGACSRRDATGCRSCASRWAPRTSSPAQHYTYDDLPAGADRLRHAALLDRARPHGDPAAAAPGARAQPADQGDRLAVEPAGLDEDEPVADRRAADRRAARSTPPTRATSSSSSRPTGAPASRSSRSRCRTSRRTASRSGYPGMDMPVAQEAKLIEALGPRLRRARAAHEDPRLRPQLVRAPERHRADAARRGSRDRVPDQLLCAGAARWIAGIAFHCYAATRAARPSCTTRSRTRASGSPSARARTAPPTRPRRSSPTRSSGTRATSCSG